MTNDSIRWNWTNHLIKRNQEGKVTHPQKMLFSEHKMITFSIPNLICWIPLTWLWWCMLWYSLLECPILIKNIKTLEFQSRTHIGNYTLSSRLHGEFQYSILFQDYLINYHKINTRHESRLVYLIKMK